VRVHISRAKPLFKDGPSYPLQPKETAENMALEAKQSVERDPYASHPNQSGGALILGHTSLLTSCLLTPDEKFIITSDRDEHIRVSWYPQGHCIESYCLGHKKYASAVSSSASLHDTAT
jgi:tRNA (guanine-N(7)-)-methyltransferase subunit TRM82